jgi:hypothetical protein
MDIFVACIFERVLLRDLRMCLETHQQIKNSVADGMAEMGPVDISSSGYDWFKHGGAQGIYIYMFGSAI